MRLIYRTTSGKSYESHDMTPSEATATLRTWRDAWQGGRPVGGVCTFRDAVLASAHVVAIEAPGLDMVWP